MKNTLILIGALATLTVSAQAETKAEAQAKKEAAAAKEKAEMLAKFDKDGDGKLSFNERAAAAKEAKKNAPAAKKT